MLRDGKTINYDKLIITCPLNCVNLDGLSISNQVDCINMNKNEFRYTNIISVVLECDFGNVSTYNKIQLIDSFFELIHIDQPL